MVLTTFPKEDRLLDWWELHSLLISLIIYLALLLFSKLGSDCYTFSLLISSVGLLVFASFCFLFFKFSLGFISLFICWLVLSADIFRLLLIFTSLVLLIFFSCRVSFSLTLKGRPLLGLGLSD